MSLVETQLHDAISPKLRKLLARTGDLSPVMRRVEKRIMRPAAARSWSRSGLRSRSGQLRKAVTAWSGRRSAGLSVRRGSGHYGYLTILKGATHMHGRARGAGDRYGRNRRHRVRAYRRGGKEVRRHKRFMPSPWGDIPARPFIPDTLPQAEVKKIAAWLEDYLVEGKDV